MVICALEERVTCVGEQEMESDAYGLQGMGNASFLGMHLCGVFVVMPVNGFVAF